jgi:hypothetical protein
MMNHAYMERDDFDRDTIDQNTAGLNLLMRARIDDGYRPYLVTLTFAHIPHNPIVSVVGRMGDAVGRLYRTFLPRVVRRPKSSRLIGSLPILIAAPDLPVGKSSKPVGPAIALNGGLHMHAVLLVPPHSRLKTTADVHFQDRQDLYARHPLNRVDVRPIVETPEIVLDCVLKSIRRRRSLFNGPLRLSFDDVLILPRALAEVR